MKKCLIIFFLLISLQLLSQNWKSGNLTTNDSIKISFSTLGDIKKPALIYVHGGPGGSCVDFISFGELLSEKYFVIIFDQRGGGLSQRTLKPEQISLQKIVNDLYQLQKHLKINKAYILGHSFGGTVAQEYAYLHNDKVRGLIIMDGYIDSNLHKKSRIKSVKKIALEEKNNELLQAIKQCEDTGKMDSNTMKLLFSEQRPYWYKYKPEYNKFNSLSLKELGYNSKNISTSHYVEQIFFQNGLFEKYSFLNKAKKLKTQCFLIFGKHDGVTTINDAKILDSLIPKSKLIIIDKCGHSPHRERPEKLKQVLFEITENGL